MGLLAAGVNSAPRMERLHLLMVEWDGQVHVLRSFLSVLVVSYATKQLLLDFRRDIPSEGIPPIAKIPVASILV